jgi:hypothetical protein
MAEHKFPSAGFLMLGVLSVAASILFLIRAAGVEATAERIWSAVAFGVMGVFMLFAYWASHRTPDH